MVKEQDNKPAVVAVEADGEDLARRFKDGDDRAFDGLVRAYQSRMFNLAYRMLNSREDAEEATQEIFVKVHGAIGDFRGDSKFTTWLYAVAVNVCRNRLRSVKRRAMFEVRSGDGYENQEGVLVEAVTKAADGPQGRLESAEMMRLVEKTIAALPAEFSSVMVMRDIQGMSYEEIAAAVGCSLGTVKSRLSRSREIVKEKLRPHLGMK